MKEYYGKTPKGKKYHKGSKVVPYVGDRRSFRVWTDCGAEIISDDLDRDYERRLEFCKRCFFKEAWDAFQVSMMQIMERNRKRKRG